MLIILSHCFGVVCYAAIANVTMCLCGVYVLHTIYGTAQTSLPWVKLLKLWHVQKPSANQGNVYQLLLLLRYQGREWIEAATHLWDLVASMTWVLFCKK